MKKVLFEIVAYSVAVAVGIGCLYSIGCLLGVILKALGV